MKKIFRLAAMFMLTASVSFAQNTLTITTRIADKLAQLPAKNGKEYKQNAEEMISWGKAGIVEMATMLTPAGTSDNEKIEFAIGGLTYFVNQKGQESARKLVAEAYAEALGKTKDKDNQAFLLFQLQQIASDEAVPAISSFLNNEYLSGRAARALARVRTDKASQALLSALPNAKNTAQSDIVQALGDAAYAPAADAIEKLAGSGNAKLQKTVLYALGEIGATSSQNILANAAKAVAYQFDNTNATSSYLHYLSRLNQNGQSEVAEKAALELINKATAANQTPVRSAGLKLYSDIKKREAVPLLVKETVRGTDSKYREAALALGQKYMMAEGARPWTAALVTAKPQVASEIVTMLGNANAQDALVPLTKLLSSGNSNLKLAAISAVAKIGQEKSLPALLGMLSKSNATETQAIKNALFSLKGDGLTNNIAKVLPKLPAPAKSAMIDVLAARAASQYSSLIFGELKNKDAGVRNAAFAALKNTATADNLPQLFTLLNGTSDAGQTSAIQNAIKSAISGAGSKEAQTALVLSQLSSSNKKGALLPVLASIGGKQALSSVVNAFKSNEASLQQDAVSALSNWSDGTAAEELYKIGEETSNATYRDQALSGYIKAINTSSETAVQKSLRLRKAFVLAQTDAQKQTILRELVKHKTFNSLIFAGQFLDEPALRQTAAQTVMEIAKTDKNIYGPEVRALLEKCLNTLEGSESNYQKEEIRKHLSELPKDEGFVKIFNGKDLTGWKGLVGNPITRAKLSADSLAYKQKIADEKMRAGWKAVNGELIFTGKGDNLCTEKQYGDIEMYVDWKLDANGKEGDAGIYLRGSPQVQIWDTSRVKVGAQVGSGGLYNNKVHQSIPSKVADNPLGEWNTFYIKMVSDRVTVYLNGELVVDNIILENLWDRNLPIFATEQLELQAHGTVVSYRDIYVREIPRAEKFELSAEEKNEGYKVLFDGSNMFEWVGNTTDYVIEDGVMVCRPTGRGHGNLYTKDEYSDFTFRFEFLLTPGANNGLGVRSPLTGDAAYSGAYELQILDNTADIYKKLEPYQYHGSPYGIVAAKRGFLKPVGEWNYQEVTVKGNKVKVTLNGTVIVDADVKEITQNGEKIADGKKHPGLFRTTGHIGFLGHGSVVSFRNIRVKDLSKVETVVAEPATKGKKASKKKKKK